MPDGGFRIADAFVEIRADRTRLREDIRDLPNQARPDADRAGREIGERIGRNMSEAGAAGADQLVRDAGGRLRNGRGELASATEVLLSGLDPIAERQGEETGGRLAEGMSQAVTRNSPLIVAAVSGALSAGAPAITAGAGLAFAGIAGVAAAQSDRVQTVWLGLWDRVKSSAEQDAQVLIPTYERIAVRVGDSFDRMRPQIADAFEGTAPLVDTLADSLLRTAENALPGFVSSIEKGQPAVQGLGALLEKTGTGLGSMLTIMAEKSPEGGAALSSLGDSIAAILPTVGELLGAGSELAVVVLPPLANVLEVVADAAGDLGPVLPAIGAGLVGMKVAGALVGPIDSLGGRLGALGTNADGSASGLGRAGGALEGLGRALPVIGGVIAIGAQLVSSFQDIGEATTDVSGYQAALQAALDETSGAIDNNVRALAIQQAAQTDIGNDTTLLEYVRNAGVDMDVFTEALLGNGEAAAAVSGQLDTWTQAQINAAIAADGGVVDEGNAGTMAAYGEQTTIAKDAINELSPALSEAKDQQVALDEATQGVTKSMVAQAEQALASIDSSFAYRNSQDALEDAQIALKDAQDNLTNSDEKKRTSSEDVARASLALEEQSYKTATAYGKQQADLSGLQAGTEEYTRIIQTETLGELHRLRDAAGPEMAAAIDQQIRRLEANGVSLDETAAATKGVSDRMVDLGFKVKEVPGYKGVEIDAPTEDQRRRIEDLGYKVVTLPNGRVFVSADTANAEAWMNHTARGRDSSIFASASTRNAEEWLNYTARNRTSYVQVITYGGDAIRSNGKVSAFSTGGKVNGPGTPTSDDVRINASRDEWVIKASSSSKYGDDFMARLNAGLIEVVDGSKAVMSYATGGQAGRLPSTPVALAAAIRQPQRAGATIHIDNLVLKIDGNFDFSKPVQWNRFIEAVRAGLIKVEREYS